MNNSKMIKKLVGMAILTSLVAVFTLMSNYIKFGSINITLALIPIAVGAILYGPLAGLFLGAVMGALVIPAPDTQAYFMSVNPAATVILCIVKSAVAGLLAGLAYKGIALIGKNKDQEAKKKITTVAAIVATILVPIVNTTLFILGAAMFFQSVYGAESFGQAVPVIFGLVFGTNFAIEATISIVLSPAVVTILKIVTKNYDLGFANDFSALQSAQEEDLEAIGA